MTHELHITVDTYGFGVLEQYNATRRYLSPNSDQLNPRYKTAIEAYKFWESLLRLTKSEYDRWLTLNNYPLLDQQQIPVPRLYESPIVIATHNIEAKDTHQ